MLEETIETPGEAAPSEEAGAESQETIEETPGAEETSEVPEPTTQEIVDAAVEKQLQKLQSWVGRREQEQTDRFTQMIADRVAPPEATPDASEEVYTDPKKWLSDELDQRDNRATAHMKKVVTSVARLMDSDSLFVKTDPRGKELGKAVTMRIIPMLHTVKPGTDADEAAESLLNKAVASVLRGKPKDNPLKGNKPTGAPLGTVTQKTPVAKKAEAPKLNDQMKKYQEIQGLSNERMGELMKRIK